MKETLAQDLIPNQLYYIQGPICSGNGKQKGFFKSISTSDVGLIFAEFYDVQDIKPYSSGYATGKRCFDSSVCKFYLPENKQIMEKNITQDPCFEYHPPVEKKPTLLVQNWMTDSKK